MFQPLQHLKQSSLSLSLAMAALLRGQWLPYIPQRQALSQPSMLAWLGLGLAVDARR